MISQLVVAGQALAIVLLYVFAWRVMRTARNDIKANARQNRDQAPLLDIAAADESTVIPAAVAARARAEQAVGVALVKVVRGTTLRTGMHFVVGNGLTFGRADDNDVTIDDTFISAHHARIQAPGTLIDLDSTNGTLINGQALHGRARLRLGDEFSLGSTTFRFEEER